MTLLGVTYSRVKYSEISAGDSLFFMDGGDGGTALLVGTVREVEASLSKHTGQMTVDCVTLNDGHQMLRKKWSRRSFWRFDDAG